MSAYVVDKKHIDYLISAAMTRWAKDGSGDFTYYHSNPAQSHQVSDKTANRIGAMLWATNQESVNSRYREEEMEGFYEFEQWPLQFSPQPVQVLKSIACYEYQSCEHEGWEASEAKAFCEALRTAAIHALPGYDAAAWGAPKAVRL